MTRDQKKRALTLSDDCAALTTAVNALLMGGVTTAGRRQLERAIGDVLESAGRLAEHQDISWTQVIARVQSK